MMDLHDFDEVLAKAYGYEKAADVAADAPALRDTDGKPDLIQIMDFGSALDALAAVMTEGAKKYAPRNWLKGGKPDSEYLSAAMRHIRAHRNGEVYAQDSRNLHLAHAAWNLLACLRLNYDDADAYAQVPGEDDDE